MPFVSANVAPKLEKYDPSGVCDTGMMFTAYSGMNVAPERSNVCAVLAAVPTLTVPNNVAVSVYILFPGTINDCRSETVIVIWAWVVTPVSVNAMTKRKNLFM